jgi:SAM-dependent methyltransferase
MPAREAVVRGARIARNALIDARHGSLLGPNHWRRGTSFSNSDYRALDAIFAGRIRPDDVLVDVGCGVGRVLNWWLHHAPGNRIVGAELDPHAAEVARRRLLKHPNVSIITGDASEVLPDDGTLFFVYNAFMSLDAWRAFNRRLVETRRGDTRVRILCHRCVALDIFQGDDAWDVDVTELGGDRSAPLGALAIISMRP